jgi:hypothetical protein
VAASLPFSAYISIFNGVKGIFKHTNSTKHHKQIQTNTTNKYKQTPQTNTTNKHKQTNITNKYKQTPQKNTQHNYQDIIRWREVATQ